MSLFDRVTDALRDPDTDAPDGGEAATAEAVAAADDDREAAATDDTGDVEPDAADGDGTADPAEPRETTSAVVAVCQRAPEGLRTYTLEVEAAGAEITEVAPGLLEAHFEVVDGGVGEDSVRVRAVDFTGEARRVEAETLVGVRFAEPVALAEARLRVIGAEGHDGATVPSESFRLASVE